MSVKYFIIQNQNLRLWERTMPNLTPPVWTESDATIFEKHFQLFESKGRIFRPKIHIPTARHQFVVPSVRPVERWEGICMAELILNDNPFR
jgi:hypothetical protein